MDSQPRGGLTRWVAHGLAWVVGLVVAGVLLLQAPPVATWVARPLVRSIAPEGVFIDFESLGWFSFAALNVENLHVRDGRAQNIFSADRVEIDHRLTAILRGRLELARVQVEGALLTLQSRPGGTWGLGFPSGGQDGPAGQTTDLLRADRLHVVDGRILVMTRTPPGTEAADTSVYVTDMDGRIAGLSVTSGGLVTGTIDTLRAGVWAGSTPRDYILSLQTQGSISGARASFPNIDIATPTSTLGGLLSVDWSDLSAEAAATLAGEFSTPLLSAEDVRAFVPTWAGETPVAASTSLTGPADSLTFEVEVEGGEYGATLGTVLYATLPAGPHLEWALQLDEIDPRVILGPESADGSINGATRGSVIGASPDSWTGSADLRLEVSELGRTVVERGEAVVALDAGAVRAETMFAAVDANGTTSVAGEVTGRPLDLMPTYAFQGRAVRTFARPGRPADTLHALVDLQGRGYRGEDLEVDARVQADTRKRAPQLGALSLRALDLVLSLRADTGRWSLNSQIASGRVTGGGTLARTAGDLTIRSNRVQWDSLSIRSGPNDSVAVRTSGRLRGSLNLDGTGLPSSSGELWARQTEVSGNRLDSAHVSWDLGSGGRLDSDWRAWVGEGLIAARLSGTSLDSTPELRIRQGRVQSVDMYVARPALRGNLSESLERSTAVTGRFEGDWQGRDAETGSGEVRWEVSGSRVNLAMRVQGEGLATLSRGILEASASLQSADGGMDLAGSLRPFEDLPDWEVEEFSTAALAVDRWTGMTQTNDVETVLNASVTGAGRGLDVTTAEGGLTAQIEASSLRGIPIDSGSVNMDLDGGAAGASIRISTDSLRIEGVTEVAFVDFDSGLGLGGYAVEADVWLSAADTLPPITVELEGHGTAVAETNGSLRVHLSPMIRRGVSLDQGVLVARLRNGLLHVDSLSVTGPHVRLAGAGAIALTPSAASDFQTELEVGSLAVARALVDARPLSIGEGRLSVTLKGPYNSLDVTATARTNAVLVDELQLVGLDAEIQATVNGTEVSRADGKAVFQSFQTPTVVVDNTTLTAGFDGDEIDLELNSFVDARRTFELSARIDPQPERRLIQLDRLNAALDEDQWELAGPTTVRYGDSLVVDSLDVRAGAQRVFVDGVATVQGGQDFEVMIDGFRIRTVSDLLGWTALEGELTARADVGGTTEAPTLDLRWETSIQSPRTPPAEVSGEATVDGGVATVKTRVLGDAGDQLAISGTVPLDLVLPWATQSGPVLRAGEGPVDLRFIADSLQVAWLRPLLDPIGLRNVTGTLDADVDVSGSAADPLLQGQVRFESGAIDLEALGTEWSGIRGTGTLDGSTVTLSDIQIRSGDGSMTAAGEVEFERLDVGAFDVVLSVDQFEAIDNSLADATLSGTGRLGGTTIRPELDADLRLLSTNLHLGGLEISDNVSDVELTEDDYDELQSTFGRDYRRTVKAPSAFADSLALSVDVSMGRDTWVRQSSNPQLAIQMTGDVTVTKARGDSISLVGEVQAIPERSFIEQFGRRFQLASGTVDFRGHPLDTRIDLLGTYSVPSVRNPDQAEVTIELGVQGTGRRIDVLLGSDPSMDDSDIVSYLATGRPASQDLQLGTEGGLSGVGTGIAIDAVANAIEGAAADRVGLDVVDIETDGLEGARLVAGRYVSPSLFVGFRQPLTRGSAPERTRGADSGTEVELEYQALRWLLLNLQAGGRGFDFLLRSRFAY